MPLCSSSSLVARSMKRSSVTRAQLKRLLGWRISVKAIVARRASLRREDETPASVLRTGVRRADASIRAIRIARWHIAIILLVVATLWITEATGLIQAR